MTQRSCSMNHVRLSHQAGAEPPSLAMRFRREHGHWNCVEEIGEGNRLVALGACPAWADSKAEDAAILAPLFTEVAR